MQKLLSISLSVVFGLMIISQPAMAQTSFPEKGLTIVIGAPPGGANDIVARLVADNVKLGDPAVPVIILHKPGAGGQIAADYAAAAKPDGYTLFLGGTAITVGPFLRKNFTPVDSYIPVVNLASLSPLLHVDAKLPIESIADLKAYAKANPGKIAVGSSGGQLDLATPVLADALGIKLKHVPFQGVAPIYTAILAGDIQMVFASQGSARPFLEAGTIRTIATGPAKRDQLNPDIPTVAEGGATGFEVRAAWFGLMAPVGTPRPIIDQLNAAFNTVLEDPEIVKRYNDLGLATIGGTPDELAEVIALDVVAFEKGAKAAGISPK